MNLVVKNFISICKCLSDQTEKKLCFNFFKISLLPWGQGVYPPSRSASFLFWATLN